ncbi:MULTISPECIES: hypothetical protein [Vagococcus]|uniref:Helix-turn-helix domain-containing protein n=1 Tax=Vagococcus carniphilus TaxID=218144 RepID=A0A430AQG8_9ENTE|nr:MULTISPECIES: hypothetical protein [Vagococcus]MDT2782611.1 hypothetical protein [Vagococcus fluvialis]QNN74549.1 hypothetical protein H9L18_14990 [Vagococcus carniphilus]RSU10359.1 hypothetical protein CBF28_13660 [Vagococcus carniphilus]
MKLEDDYISVDEAYFLLKGLGLVSQEQTVRRWIREGKIKGHKESNKLGYQVSLNSLENYVLERRKVELSRQLVYRKGYIQGFEDAKKLIEYRAKIREDSD